MLERQPPPRLKCKGCGYPLFDWFDRCPECGGRYIRPERHMPPLGDPLAWEAYGAKGFQTWRRTAVVVDAPGALADALDLHNRPTRAGSFARRGSLMWLGSLVGLILLVALAESGIRRISVRGEHARWPANGLIVYSDGSVPWWDPARIEVRTVLRQFPVTLAVLGVHGWICGPLAARILTRARVGRIDRPDERPWMGKVLHQSARYALPVARLRYLPAVAAGFGAVYLLAAVIPAAWSHLWAVTLALFCACFAAVPLLVLRRTARILDEVLDRLAPTIFKPVSAAELAQPEC